MDVLNALIILSNFLPIVALVVGSMVVKNKNNKFNFGIFLLVSFFLLRGLNEIFFVIETRYFFITFFQILWFLGMYFVFVGGIEK